MTKLPDPIYQSRLAGSGSGLEAISNCIAHLPPEPGVYRMYDEQNEVLYVGKAKNLRRRVASYARTDQHNRRISRMIFLVRSVDFIVTPSETNALLLETQLIKRLRPRFNILMRDDKNFPYILIRDDHEAPQILKYRGKRQSGGSYFGPYASTGAVNQALLDMQKAFLLRSCTDSVYAGRSRACLLYQIKRCAGPCVGHVSLDEYAGLVAQARAFLDGEASHIQDELARQMEAAAEALNFEQAAKLRDRVRALARIRETQAIDPAGLVEADIFAIAARGSHSCIQVFFVRAGQCRGAASYFPAHGAEASTAEIIGAFISQFYDKHPCPAKILTNVVPLDKELIAAALSTRRGKRVMLHTPQRGAKHALLAQVGANAAAGLARQLVDTENRRQIKQELIKQLALRPPVERIEIFDNSHIRGNSAVGGMVVAGPDGFDKRQYRSFTIKSSDLTPGDDYAMMREVLRRRFAGSGSDKLPDLVLIDGGAGHLTTALEVWRELGFEPDRPRLAAIAKGPDRFAGREKIFFCHDSSPLQLPEDSPLLYYLQRLRDEAHRFAIGVHRRKRNAAISTSPLDQIAGLGPVRKKALLHRFGSARSVAGASKNDLETTTGISAAMAERIHNHFRER